MSELRTTSLSHKDNNTGTPNITMFPDGTTSLPGMAMGGFRNQLINGDFRVAQRGIAVTETTSGYRTLDRWYVARTASCEEEQVNSVALEAEAGTAKSMRLNPGNAGEIRQMIEIPEGRAGCFQVDTTWTLSFYCNREGVKVSAGFADGISGGNNFVNIQSQITAQRIGTTNKYSVTFTIPALPNGNNKGLRIILTPSTVDFTDFTGIQLEPGPVATPFEHRPIGTELALCQRYYQKSYPKGVIPGSLLTEGVVSYSNFALTSQIYSHNFATEMRASPSMKIWARNGTPNQAQLGTSGNLTDITGVSGCTTGFTFKSDNGTASRCYLLHFTADAEL